jgi:hypothetical protein
VVFAALTFFVGRSAMFNVQADRGGIAIGGNVTGATITTGGTTNSDSTSKPK